MSDVDVSAEMEMDRERDVERYFVDRVKRLGGTVRKVKWTGRAGAPDRLAYGPRLRACFVEMKRPKGGKLSHQQKVEITKLVEGGFDVFVASNHTEVDALVNWMTEQ